MALSDRLTRAQEILGHEFNNKVLLRAALTHPSAVEGQPVSASYERLEFLGDSILGAVVARSLFESYPEFDEGKLTRLKVSLDGIRQGRGSGSSKKEAEGAAALEALDRMGYTTNGVILNKKHV